MGLLLPAGRQAGAGNRIPARRPGQVYPDRHIAYQFQSQLHEHNRALEYSLSFLFLSRLSSGQAQRRYRTVATRTISTTESLYVGRHFPIPSLYLLKRLTMKRITAFFLGLCFAIFICLQATAQKLPTRWDEITAADWNNALAKSNKTCILPIGIL